MFSQAAGVNNEEAQGGGGPPLPVAGAVSKLAEYPRRMRNFLHEVRVEMKQVTWPTWPDITATTLIVLLTVLFFGVYFFFVDSVVGLAERQVYRLFKH